MKIQSILVGSLIAFLSINNNSQTWEFIGGPDGGDVFKYAIDSSDNVFASTWEGGLYLSTDNGFYWHLIDNTIGTAQVYAIEVSNENIIYIGANGMGLLYSTDLGENWNKVNSLNLNTVYSLGINSVGDIFCSGEEGLFRSSDEGTSWILLDTTLNVELAICSDNDIIAATYDSVFSSTNNGESWMNISNNLPSGAISTVIVTNVNNYLYVVKNYSEIYRSTDFGNYWTLVSEDLNFPRVVYFGNGNLFAGGNDCLFVSTNFGDEWTSIKNNELSNDWVRSITTNLSGDIFIGTMGGGIYFSSNNGSNWEIRNDGLKSGLVRKLLIEENYIYCAMYGAGIFRSSDGCETWESVTNNIPSLSIKTVYRHIDGSLFAGTSLEGLYKSTDEGESWTFSSSVGPHTIVSNSAGDIFIGAQGRGIYRSTDSGTSWENINNGITHLAIQQLDVGNNDEIFACYPNSSFYKSTNNGDSWMLVNDGLSGDLWSIEIDDSNKIYVGSSQGFFTSTNGGESWTIINEITRISDIIIAPDNIIYGVKYNGAYYFTDDGTNWHFIGEGLENSSPDCLGTDFDQYLYLGTQGSGLYRLNFSALYSGEGTSSVINDFELLQNYPNPFNPKTNISFRINEYSHVSLKVYDVLGKEIITLVNEEKARGTYEFEFDASRYSSGVYFYRIIAGHYIKTKKMVLLK